RARTPTITATIITSRRVNPPARFLRPRRLLVTIYPAAKIKKARLSVSAAYRGENRDSPAGNHSPNPPEPNHSFHEARPSCPGTDIVSISVPNPRDKRAPEPDIRSWVRVPYTLNGEP